MDRKVENDHLRYYEVKANRWKPSERAAKTVITKLSDEMILIKRYWLNGKLKYEANLNEMPKELHGKADGTEVTMKDYTTRNGSKHGLVCWYYESGQMQREVNYKKGEKDGEWTSWDENGKIKYKGSYENCVSSNIPVTK